MPYLIGDSHATELFQSWEKRLPGLIWKTALGYGLQNLVRDNHRAMDTGRETLIGAFASIPKNEIVIVSYTDVDGRLGLGPLREGESLKEDYANVVDLLFELIDPKKLVFIDWYGISSICHSGQTISSEQRVQNRDFQLAALENCKTKWPDRLLVHSTRHNLDYEDESGIAKLKILKDDDVHFDFSAPIHETHLFPLIEQWNEE